MTDISKKTIEKIKKEKITPIPKWHFWVKNDLVLALALIAALVAALSMAVAVHIFQNRDWFIYRTMPGRPPMSHLATDLPLVWLGLLALALIVAVYYFERSKKGYHWSAVWLISAGVIFSLAFGCYFSSLGFGKKVDSFVGDKIPGYRDIERGAREVWSEPEAGRLGGEIAAIDGETWTVRDLGGRLWQVDTADLRFRDLKPIIGAKVKIVGEKTEENLFRAQEIHNWRSPFDFFSQSPSPVFNPMK